MQHGITAIRTAGSPTATIGCLHFNPECRPLSATVSFHAVDTADRNPGPKDVPADDSFRWRCESRNHHSIGTILGTADSRISMVDLYPLITHRTGCVQHAIDCVSRSRAYRTIEGTGHLVCGHAGHRRSHHPERGGVGSSDYAMKGFAGLEASLTTLRTIINE